MSKRRSSSGYTSIPVIEPAGPTELFAEHAEDVLSAWLGWHATGAALVVVTRTEGGGVRAPGAMMAVSAYGRRAGYVSGGCLDADVAAHALAAIADGKPRGLRYGSGSPFVDLPLPCGGAMEVLIIPRADAEAIRTCYAKLASRQPVRIGFSAQGEVLPDPDSSMDFVFRHVPKLKLRVAGRGADVLALAKLARASGIETELHLRETDAAAIGLPWEDVAITLLGTPTALPPLTDDPWTAFLLAFHDADWEDPLLTQALSGPAFFIGAVGSRKTQARRCARLSAAGVNGDQIGRIRGPVGLLPSMREASMLAVSVMAEIAGAWQSGARAPFADTALVLLAAGESSRFEGGDKLLASYRGRRVIDHSARLLTDKKVAARIAIVAPDQSARAHALRTAGWTVTICQDAIAGQAASLAAGIRAATNIPQTDAALVLLADMPAVPEAHLFALREALTPNCVAVLSQRDEVRMPPAIFSRHAFTRLVTLTGDQGASQIFNSLGRTTAVPISPHSALDIDTR